MLRLPRSRIQPVRHERPRALWSLAALAALLVANGCRSISGQGAVSQSVATCRQYSQQGIAAIERGQFAEAESLLSRAVEACPIDTDARRHYGEALWQQGARREAVMQVEQAIRLNRHDPTLRVRAGEMYLAMDELTKAREKVDDALRIDSQLATGWALRARINVAENRSVEALADFHRALGFAPDDPRILFEMAQLYTRVNEPQRALSTLQQLVDTYLPDEVPRRVYYVQGLAFVSLGRYDDAADSQRLAAQRGRPDAEILFRLAEAELLAQRPQAAHWAARGALQIEPRHEPSRRLLDRIELAGRRSEARGL